MALRDAMMVILDEMEEIKDEQTQVWYRRIKKILDRHPQETIQPTIQVPPREPSYIDHRNLIEKAKEEMRASKSPEKIEEGIEQQLECVGGPCDKEFAITDSAMPTGARMFLGGTHVYEKSKEGRLIYVPPQIVVA
jgi:hypothetical protein